MNLKLKIFSSYFIPYYFSINHHESSSYYTIDHINLNRVIKDSFTAGKTVKLIRFCFHYSVRALVCMV